MTIMMAGAVMPLAIAACAAIDISRLAEGRATLQRAVDSAAVSGAATYTINAPSVNARAIMTATSAFCETVNAIGPSFTVAAGAGGAQQNCNAGGGTSTAGPSVTAVTDSYITGVPGISHTSGISCTGTYLPSAPYNCGFIVTVSAQVTIQTVLPPIFGNSASISASGMAVNPFISFAKIFSFPNGVVSGAKYANSVWAYALSLNADGTVNYATNGGAVPDTSACTGGPDQVNCGTFTMLASTMYAGKGNGYTPPGDTTIYDSGVVRNPLSPTQITATTPLGIAFRSIAGGNYVQYSPPGVYGYQVTNLGNNPPTYTRAPNNCIYPYYNLVYHTVTQVWNTTSTTSNGTITQLYTPVLPWTLVTHWFFSSFLSNNQPPSQALIEAQTMNNENIPSVTNDAAQAGGNISGNPTYAANPSPAVPASCPSTTTVNGTTTSNDTFQTTTFPTTGNDNCSLYITSSTSPGSTTPNATYTGSCFDPGNTPGETYASMSCQGYGANYYTFFWNDMGGAVSDNDNYGDGVVQLSCASASHVALIN